MSDQLKEIQSKLLSASGTSNEEFFRKIIPGVEKIYGVKTPLLNELVKQYKSGSFGLVEELWNAGALEEKMIAIKIVEKIGKKEPGKVLPLFKKFSKEIDNWAVCDGLGMLFLRGIVKTHAEEIFALAEKYNRSKDPWQRRLSLVMVEWYTRDKSHLPEIKKLADALESDKEYYVRKAVSWIRRNFKKGK